MRSFLGRLFLNQQGFIGWIFLIFLVGLLLGSVFVVVNSFYSLPGDFTYPVKEIMENLRLSANELSFKGRASVYLDLSAERLNELQKMVAIRDKQSQIIPTLAKLQDQQKKAIINIEREVSNKGNDVIAQIARLEANVKRQQMIFPELRYQVVEPNSSAFEKALAESTDTLDKVKELKNR